MQDIDRLIQNNAKWAAKIRVEDPNFFEDLAK